MSNPSPSAIPKQGPVRPNNVAPENPNLWTLYIKDRASRPICGLSGQLRIGEKILPFTTGTNGEIGDLPRCDCPIKVEVEKTTGGHKQVAELKLLSTTEAVVLTSPKMKHEGRTRAHELTEARSSAPQASPHKDWIKEVLRSNIKDAGVQLTYQCHSPTEREKYYWKPSPQLKKLMNESAAMAKKGLGRVVVPVLGQGNTIATRDPKGNPATIVGVESWDGQLALGVNEKWRPALQEASGLESVKNAGIKIFTLAAIINAEAGTIRQTVTTETEVRNKKTGVVIKDKKTGLPLTRKSTKTIDTGEWNETAVNPTGDAAGLTQFIRSSWRDMAADPKTQLGQHARSQGWVSEKEILASERGVSLFDSRLPQRLERLKEAKEVYEKQQAQSKTTKRGSRIKPPSPPKTRKIPLTENDGNRKKLLDLRLDGRFSILTAAEAAAGNLRLFESGYKFAVSSVSNSFEIAKLVYFLHFLGPARAASLGAGSMEEPLAKYLYCQQYVNKEDPKGENYGERKYKSSNWSSWNEALWEFASTIVDGRLVAGFNKFCKPAPTDQGRSLRVLIEAIKP